MGAIMGGNVRVGLEDNIYLGKGELATSNADQVGKIVRILNELSLDIATPDEAREMLHSKGVHNVGVLDRPSRRFVSNTRDRATSAAKSPGRFRNSDG